MSLVKKVRACIAGLAVAALFSGAAYAQRPPDYYQEALAWSLSGCSDEETTEAVELNLGEEYFKHLHDLGYSCGDSLAAWKNILPLGYAHHLHPHVSPKAMIEFWISDRSEEAGVVAGNVEEGQDVDIGWHIAHTPHFVKRWQERDPLEYFTHAQDLGMEEEKTYRFYQLGVPISEINTFTDTEKPNATVIYPVADHNGAFYTENKLHIDTAPEKLRERYDVILSVASNEGDMCRLTMNATGSNLFIIKGHGTPKSLTLGYAEGEEAAIDTEDYLRDCFPWQKQITIYTESCRNAEGHTEGKGLSVHISRQVPNAIVYGSTISFDPLIIRVDYPFEPIMNKEQNQIIRIDPTVSDR